MQFGKVFAGVLGWGGPGAFGVLQHYHFLSALVKKREANSICRVDNGDNGENEVIFYPNLHIALLTNSMEIDLNKYRNLYFGINL